MEKLTQRQRQVLETIIDFVKTNEYPPTLRELADALGASSRNSAVKHLTTLDRKGYIKWGKNKARGIKIIESLGLLNSEHEQSLPLIGSVTAGMPMLAEENIQRYVPVPDYLIRSKDTHFLLQVQGESMRDAGILTNDLVIVRQQNTADDGSIVVALMDSEATVKRLARRDDGLRYLRAENPVYPDIYPEGEWTLQGRVVGLIREQVE